jgi:hypothetical protein
VRPGAADRRACDACRSAAAPCREVVRTWRCPNPQHLAGKWALQRRGGIRTHGRRNRRQRFSRLRLSALGAGDVLKRRRIAVTPSCSYHPHRGDCSPAGGMRASPRLPSANEGAALCLPSRVKQLRSARSRSRFRRSSFLSCAAGSRRRAGLLKSSSAPISALHSAHCADDTIVFRLWCAPLHRHAPRRRRGKHEGDPAIAVRRSRKRGRERREARKLLNPSGQASRPRQA